MTPSILATVIDHSITKKSLDLLPILDSIADKHDLDIKASHTGIQVYEKKGGKRRYSHGVYSPVKADTPANRTIYRYRLIKFLRFCADYMSTDELKAALPWLQEQDEWK